MNAFTISQSNPLSNEKRQQVTVQSISNKNSDLQAETSNLTQVEKVCQDQSNPYFFPVPQLKKQQKIIGKNEQKAQQSTNLTNKKYNNIAQETRIELISRILSKQFTLKQAAHSLNIKISTAKVIFRNFVKEGRIGKKTTRAKRSKKERMQTVKKNEPNDIKIENQNAAIQGQLPINHQINQGTKQICNNLNNFKFNVVNPCSISQNEILNSEKNYKVFNPINDFPTASQQNNSSQAQYSGFVLYQQEFNQNLFRQFSMKYQ